jgi:hypothetical protein
MMSLSLHMNTVLYSTASTATLAGFIHGFLLTPPIIQKSQSDRGGPYPFLMFLIQGAPGHYPGQRDLSVSSLSRAEDRNTEDGTEIGLSQPNI